MTAAEAEAIVAAEAAVREARHQLARAVAAARTNGASWHDVGVALGITRQAAWERFSERASS
jgi:hypothetical protein